MKEVEMKNYVGPETKVIMMVTESGILTSSGELEKLTTEIGDWND